MTCKVGVTVRGNSSEYSILKFIGEGSFGKVVKCQNVDSKETVAIKFLKEDPEVMKDAEKEVSMLQLISGMDPDRINVVKFLERFQHEGQPCLAFEMLYIDLFNVLEVDRPMCLNGIRPIAQQLMVALDALQSIGVMHTDIKPDNIMIARLDMPVRVKLIDFGMACHTSDVQCGQILQTFRYRAPEVHLGLPFNEAIDVWSVGCVLAFLYLAANLFPCDSRYELLRFMFKILGLPEDHLLRAGKYTHKYFTEVSTGNDKGQAEGRKRWRLLTLTEYNRRNNITPPETMNNYVVPNSLNILRLYYPMEDGPAECDDRFAFVDLLKGLLHLDGAKRLTPSQALQHTFITMSHLSKHSDKKDYLRNTRKMMGISPSLDQESSSGSHQDASVVAPSSTDSETNKDKDDGPTEETTDGPTQETPDSWTEETTDGPTQKTPDGRTEETTDGPTKEIPDGPTAEKPDSPTAETPDGPTKEIPDGPTAEKPDSPTAEIPDGPTGETPDDFTAETPDEEQDEHALEELRACLLKNYGEDNDLKSSEAEQTDPPPRQSTSIGRRLMRRICKFFRGIKKAVCCCCCQVEDN